jgi:hypothetical protein
LNAALHAVPDGFTLHPKLVKQLERRANALDGEGATIEQLSATLTPAAVEELQELLDEPVRGGERKVRQAADLGEVERAAALREGTKQSEQAARRGGLSRTVGSVAAHRITSHRSRARS